MAATPRPLHAAIFAIALALQACAASPPSANALVDEAAKKIRRNAYYADRVDWSAAVAEAKTRVADSSSPAGAYPAIDWLLQRLGDGHSFLLRPQRAKEVFEKTTVDDVVIESQDLGDVVVVGVPTFVGTTAIRERTYATRLHAVFERSVPPRCGWVVDLRRDEGGNMFPMLAGLAPLLGTVDIGRFVSRQGATPWPTRAIYDRSDMVRSTFESPDLRDAPVAVVTSRWTVSSGEAVAIAFRGRPNTKTFGTATGGKSTGNEVERLSDGSMLLVATAVMADRTGQRYGGPIEPDERADATYGPVGFDDAARAAAIRWLRERCSAGERTAG